MAGRFVLGNYSYDTKAEWEEAKKEEESIKYIRSKTNLNDAATVAKLYQAMVTKKTFITPTGMNFMIELREFLLKSGQFTAEEIPGVPVLLPRKKGKRAIEFEEENENKNKMRASLYQQKLKNARIVIGVLAAVIITLFLITAFGPNSPFVDAEIKVQNKYAAWEQELTQRENELIEREKALENK